MNRRLFMHQLAKGTLSATAVGTSLSASAADYLLHTSKAGELASHTIADISYTDVQLKWPRFVGKNGRRDIHGYGPKVSVCVLTTDQGAKGWGMHGSRNAEAIAYLKGKRVSEVFQPSLGVTDSKALGFDVPLHDLAGVILNKPVYELMGQKKPILTKCYSGMIYFDELEPKEGPVKTTADGLDRLLENCRHDYELGYRQLKLKIGRGNIWMPKEEGLKRDIEVTKLVAKTFPDVEILVDANDGYTVDTTIAYLKGIGDIPLFWMEEPFAETVADYQKLRAWTKDNKPKMLLADGEADPRQELLRELEDRKLIDVHLTDMIGYGFTPWRKLMPELKSRGILASPHAFGELLKSYYCAHLAGALGNTVTIEGVPATCEAIDFGKYTIKKGQFVPSPDPGFGMTLLKKV
ncbi:enolase C-terminal domain-like protein [Siphonobacter sp. SORGH_AS_1065]|uniref:enolase C-terminal domain-like protein n=1 Tax=Siphonobacter sp. SORGH_AS_1065 TaxID=3041795 RepID=UPI002788FF16|nr:enolase C-terminal domain-like protein [Siphonobacter sp. SORGH_AS_1065]MDQ1089752.1 D-galactarolactone cycloisomerase [Siphonobacter sp. SORGH_AS_1065]